MPLMGMSLIVMSLFMLSMVLLNPGRPGFGWLGINTAGAWQLPPASDPILADSFIVAPQWVATPVAGDPLVRMPGTQPDQGVNIDGPSQCINCHADYDPLTEPVNNWQGSMMAQAACFMK